MFNDEFREIKFRAWVIKDQGEDISPYMDYSPEQYVDMLKEYKEGNIILMQHTGHYKREVPIYEGDLFLGKIKKYKRIPRGKYDADIKFSHCEDMVFEVKYCTSINVFETPCFKLLSDKGDEKALSHVLEMEHVGNRFERKIYKEEKCT